MNRRHVVAGLAGVAVLAILAVLAARAEVLRQFVHDPLTRVAVAVAGAPPAPPRAWSRGQPAPTDAFEAQRAIVDDKLYVFGGYVGNRWDAPAQTRVSVYDPATDAWSRAAEMPVALTHAHPAVDGGVVWFAGGFAGPYPGPAVATVLKYDAGGDRWSEAPSLPAPVASGTLALIERTLHYIGGFRADGGAATGEHWILPLDGNGKWEARAPLPAPRGHLASAVLDGRIFAIGGQSRHDADSPDVALVHAYDPRSDAWLAVADLPAPRSHCEAGTFVHGGRIYVVGGRDNTRGPYARRAGLVNITAYDPYADAWTELPTLPLGLEGPVAGVAGARLVVTQGSPLGGVGGQSATFIGAVD